MDNVVLQTDRCRTSKPLSITISMHLVDAATDERGIGQGVVQRCGVLRVHGPR